jgi:hypothetical protein
MMVFDNLVDSRLSESSCFFELSPGLTVGLRGKDVSLGPPPLCAGAVPGGRTVPHGCDRPEDRETHRTLDPVLFAPRGLKDKFRWVGERHPISDQTLATTPNLEVQWER